MPGKKKKKTYAEWFKSLPDNLRHEGGDYNLRVAYERGEDPTKNGHLSDSGKLPHHITFSDESVYHGKKGEQGGRWGNNTFSPGSSNLKHWTKAQIQAYFTKNEPGYQVRYDPFRRYSGTR